MNSLYDLLTKEANVSKKDVAELHNLDPDDPRAVEILEALETEGYENLEDD